MTSSGIKFVNYNHSHFADCLKLFDENCPEYFAENEKQDYSQFLKSKPAGYFVVQSGRDILSVFGLIVSEQEKSNRARLTWILVSQNKQGKGAGHAMMDRVQQLASEQSVSIIDIAASHLSAPFFTKFGATKLSELPDGWGEGMHRIDMELKVL